MTAGGQERRGLIRSTGTLAAATFFSRILGFVRDILFARYLGGGVVMTAWALAFMVANFFRRFLGEGALSNALVPILSYTLEQDDHLVTRRKLASIFAGLSLILALLCVLVGGGSYLLRPYANVTRVSLMLQIMPLIIPYAFFICMIGAMTAVLNTVGRFFLPAMGAILLNLSLIFCLWLICSRISNHDLARLQALSLAVLAAGLLQTLFMMVLLGRVGLLPWREFISAGRGLLKDPVLGELWHLILPGLVGASALQISLVVDKSLACWLGPRAVPALYYSDRLVYLPIGVFAVSMGAVILPGLSRYAARNDNDGLSRQLRFGMRQILFLCIPVAVFLYWFRMPVLRLCFLRGEFDLEALNETAWALLFYIPGIPAFAAIKILVGGFHARKDMQTPLKISLVCVVVNIILNLILMLHLRQGGIALATSIAAFLNCFLLMWFLSKALGTLSWMGILLNMVRCLAAGIMAAIFAKYCLLRINWTIPLMPTETIPLIVAALVFSICYIALMIIMRGREPFEWLWIIFGSRIGDATDKPGKE